MRRSIIVYPELQFSFVVSFLIGVSLIAGVLAGTNMLAVYLLRRSPSMSAQQSLLLDNWLHSWLPGAALIFVVLLAASAFIALRLSYQFYGPLHRMERWLEKMLSGEPTTALVVRTGDETERIVWRINHIVTRAKSPLEGYRRG